MKKVLLVTALSAAMGATVAMADPLPPGPGRNVVVSKCSSCHATALIENEHHDADGWQDTVDKMVDRGLVVSDAERGQIVAYLARVLGPQTTPASAIKPAAAAAAKPKKP